MSASTTTEPAAPSTTAAEAAKAARLTWGQWVTHVDSAGQAPSMDTSADPSGLEVTATFDKLSLKLGGDAPLAASVVLSGHYPVTVADGVPLAALSATLGGFVFREPGCSVVVTLTVGDDVRTLQWSGGRPSLPEQADAPDQQTVDEEPERPFQGDDTEFTLDLLTRDAVHQVSTGDGTTSVTLPFPPLPVSIELHARRASAADEVQVEVLSLDLQALLTG